MFSGAYTAIVTPFKDGKIDVDSLKNLIEIQIENGIAGIVPCGTTGESPTLSHDEHKEVIKKTIEFVNGRVKVIAGSGSNSTREAVELTTFAKEAGADAALVITPYYNKPTQKGLFLHFETIAEETDIPLILYNVPGRTGVNLEVDTIVSLSNIPGIVGIKEASGCVLKASEIVRQTNLTVISGDDGLTYPILSVGGKGVISVASNIAPDKMVKMVNFALEGKYEEARKVHFELAELNRKLFLETNPIPVKAALAKMGLINGEVRLPLCPMSNKNLTTLEEELKMLGLIE